MQLGTSECVFLNCTWSLHMGSFCICIGSAAKVDLKYIVGNVFLVSNWRLISFLFVHGSTVCGLLICISLQL